MWNSEVVNGKELFEEIHMADWLEELTDHHSVEVCDLATTLLLTYFEENYDL